jgi:vacuolar-type H+-ATPase subunit I/STV1
MLALLVAVLAWATQRIRRAERHRRTDPAELALIERAAEGDEAAARELSQRADREAALLRLRAQTDRAAATHYRTQLQDQLRTLDSLPARLANMDVPEEKRREVRERIDTQRTALARELTWVEERLRTFVSRK